MYGGYEVDPSGRGSERDCKYNIELFHVLTPQSASDMMVSDPAAHGIHSHVNFNFLEYHSAQFFLSLYY